MDGKTVITGDTRVFLPFLRKGKIKRNTLYSLKRISVMVVFGTRLHFVIQ